jgi:ferric-dicitrate binding protein FerR (iron transport regulator)
MDWDRQISDYLDGRLGTEETIALFDWLKADPENMRRLARAACIHSALRDHFAALRELEINSELETHDLSGSAMANAMILPALSEVHESAPADPPAPLPFVELPRRRVAVSSRVPAKPRRSHGWSYAAAIFLLVASASLYWAWPAARSVRVVAAHHAVWGQGTASPVVGEKLPAGDLTLEQGVVKLGFASGNEVIVEGPARFSVRNDLAIDMRQGRLSALISSTGRGLRVSTPDAQVIDLGTEFGVETHGGTTQVAVFQGRVTAASNADAARGKHLEVVSGAGAEVSATGVKPLELGAVTVRFPRVMPGESQHLNLVDMLAGGDGTGENTGFGIDAGTGRAGTIEPVGEIKGTRTFVKIIGHPVLDGCFIPGGRMQVDSAGHPFDFPTTSFTTEGPIWGGRFLLTPAGPPSDISFRRESYSSRTLVMPPNNGLTLDLGAVRTLHGGAILISFRARAGYAADDAPAAPTFASVHVLVDGKARFERRGFTDRDNPFEVVCQLADGDRFLTLATTDGGDSPQGDLVIWKDLELEIRKAPAALQVSSQ